MPRKSVLDTPPPSPWEQGLLDRPHPEPPEPPVKNWRLGGHDREIDLVVNRWDGRFYLHAHYQGYESGYSYDLSPDWSIPASGTARQRGEVAQRLAVLVRDCWEAVQHGQATATAETEPRSNRRVWSAHRMLWQAAVLDYHLAVDAESRIAGFWSRRGDDPEESPEAPPPLPRRFLLDRLRDHSGVSGTGIVVEGVLFTSGRVGYDWTGPDGTTVVAQDLLRVERVHGHQGATRLVWIDPEGGG